MISKYIPFLSADLSSKYALDLLSWMLGPEYILENYLQVTDNYLVEEGLEEELDMAGIDTESEDPTFDPLPGISKDRDSSDSEESSLTSLDSDSESNASKSSEFWESHSSDGEDYLMSAEEKQEEDKANLDHQSTMFNDEEATKRMFESDDGETDEDHKRQKLDLNESAPDNDEISSSNNDYVESDQQCMPVVHVIRSTIAI